MTSAQTTPLVTGTITVDGSFGEGGGQITRHGAVYSALQKIPVDLTNIRAGREKPGALAQHVHGVSMAVNITGGSEEGVEVGSSTFKLVPAHKPVAGNWSIDPGTAASISLFHQIVTPLFLFTGAGTASTVMIHGGSDVQWAPPFAFTKHVLEPFLESHFGARTAIELHRQGYFPKGGGSARLVINAMDDCLTPINLTVRGDVECIEMYACDAGWGADQRIAEKMLDAARGSLERNGAEYCSMIHTDARSDAEQEGGGFSFTILARTTTGCILSSSQFPSKKTKPEKLARDAVCELLYTLNTPVCVDEQLEDQIIMYMALAKGKSVVRTASPTPHTITAIHVAQQLTSAVFEIKRIRRGLVDISCTGIGFGSTTPE
jgi:RNA 3'-terminal phosphate cyclase (ATP)